jgi:hypothetical protein
MLSLLLALTLSAPPPHAALDTSFLGDRGDGARVFTHHGTQWAAVWGHRIHFFDFSNPRKEVSSIELPGYISDVAYQDDYLYVASYYGLTLIDLADIARPAVETTFDDYDPHAVLVRGNHVYLGGGYPKLRVVDVNDKKHPQEVGSCGGGDGAIDGMAFHDSHIIYSQNSEWIGSLDISDPLHPVTVDSLPAAAWSWDIAVHGDIAYIAAGDAGLEKMAIGPDGKLTRLSARKIHSGLKLCLSEPFLYVSGSSGIYTIWDIRDDQSYQFGNNALGDVSAIAADRQYMLLGRKSDGIDLYRFDETVAARPKGSVRRAPRASGTSDYDLAGRRVLAARRRGARKRLYQFP